MGAGDRFHLSACKNPVFNISFSADKHIHSPKTGKICYLASETKHCPMTILQRSTALKYIHTLQRSLFKLQ